MGKNSNYILVNRVSKCCFLISSRNVFFDVNNEVEINVLNDKIIFKTITIDSKNINKIRVNNKDLKWKQTNVSSEKLEEGKYIIDEEESTESELVIYFEDLVA